MIKQQRDSSKLSTLFFLNLKTPLDKIEISNVVYKIPGLDCKRYRCLKGKITLHKSDCRKNFDRCALAEQTTNTNHQIGWVMLRFWKDPARITKELFQ